MTEKPKKKYELKKKNNDFEEFVKRNGLYFGDARKYKNDADFRELCELLEGKITDINDNLFVLRLNCLCKPNESERLEKFKDAYRSQDGSAKHGSKPLAYLDQVLIVCKLIDNTGQLTKKGYRFINAYLPALSN